ncbi:MAG: hypothetical protein AABW89_04605 [Nanoarchaeota archaeon]
MEIFEPRRSSEKDSYALVVPAGGTFVIIETFPSLEQLETGYSQWLNYALAKEITLPLPMEFKRKLDADRNATGRIMQDLVNKLKK